MKATKRSRQFVEFLRGRMKKGKALIVMHDNPDPDCFASAMCLKRIFEQAYRTPTTLAYGGVIGRAENRKMLAECRIQVQRMDQIRLEDYSYTVTVDSQPGGGNTVLKSPSQADMVIDHHPRKATTRNIPWVDIRTKYGATSTITFDYCIAHGLDFSKNEATALMYALKTETKDLGAEAAPADRRAYMHLLPRSDFNSLYNITHAEVSKEYFIVLSRALEKARVHSDVMITTLGDIGTPEYVGEVADILLRMRGVDWTMVSGQYRNSTYLSIRTNDRVANSGEIMQQVLEGLGDGGGHDMMAGGCIKQVPEGMDTEKLDNELTGRLLRALRKRSQGSGLLREE